MDAYQPIVDAPSAKSQLPGRIVLVLQGGGALGAYQGGVYQALHEADIEPDWVIGTSIGAINGAIIAGNDFHVRLDKLREFWTRITHKGLWEVVSPFVGNAPGTMMTFVTGLPGFFGPNPATAWGMMAAVGVDRAAFYSTNALQATLSGLIDFERIKAGSPRFTVGAVNVRTGRMHYFDSSREHVTLTHVLASGALPPAFPAVLIDGEPYWDGGLYSNTPVETVFDDSPRLDSVVFTVQVWNSAGPEPESIWQVLDRQKDIQYASRADSHIDQQRRLHELRRVVRELVSRLPEDQSDIREALELAGHGCGTTMHIVRLNAPRLAGEDYMRDIDFSSEGIRARWEAGYADTLRSLERKPWNLFVDPMIGVAVHDPDEQPPPRPMTMSRSR